MLSLSLVHVRFSSAHRAPRYSEVAGYPRQPRRLTKAPIRVNRLILDECFSGGGPQCRRLVVFLTLSASRRALVACISEDGELYRHSRCLSSAGASTCCVGETLRALSKNLCRVVSAARAAIVQALGCTDALARRGRGRGLEPASCVL